ncbi:hypothetical protein DFJ77DRAFT_125327 [Powellomyces hirtus]|nr:hypothetical protein DFJ77DRAFT_125327 [Powellomyces hirtus]
MGLPRWCSCFGGPRTDGSISSSPADPPPKGEERKGPKVAKSTVTPLNPNDASAEASRSSPIAHPAAASPVSNVVSVANNEELQPLIKGDGNESKSTAAPTGSAAERPATNPSSASQKNRSNNKNNTSPNSTAAATTKPRPASKRSTISSSSSSSSSSSDKSSKPTGPPKPIAAFGDDDLSGGGGVGVRGLLNRAKLKKTGDAKTNVVEMDVHNGAEESDIVDDDSENELQLPSAGVAGIEPKRIGQAAGRRERQESSHVMSAHPFEMPDAD